jgi:aryl carrier-like protein
VLVRSGLDGLGAIAVASHFKVLGMEQDFLPLYGLVTP